MGDRRNYIIQQIVKYANKLDEKGFGANHDGNVSAKFEDILLATPTAVSKGNIVPEIIISLDLAGKKIAGIGNPFSEMDLHLAAYRARPEITAVVHSHPPFATAMGLTGQPLRPVLPEAVVSIGDYIPVTKFIMPKAKDSEEVVTQALSIADVFIMPGNGVFAIGDNVEQAYLRLELVEHVAKIQYYAKIMGTPMELATEDLNTLLQKRASLGLGPKKTSVSELIKDLITQEIKKELQS